MKFNFPKIKIKGHRNKIKRQVYKIQEETYEYLEELDDMECLDILQATETLIRLHFKGREKEIDDLIDDVIIKNLNRGYYEK